MSSIRIQYPKNWRNFRDVRNETENTVNAEKFQFYRMVLCSKTVKRFGNDTLHLNFK